MKLENQGPRSGLRPECAFDYDAKAATLRWPLDPVPLPAPAGATSVLQDLAICGDCVREIFDRHDRRHRYPFTTCRNCGPRYSILRRAPMRRANTTMSAFAMCSACRAEFETPGSRRYMDEAVSCPFCGPALRAVTPTGEVLGSVDPILLASRALRAQLTVVIKNDGGFSYACDATSSVAVSRLRQRCGNADMPMTVMIRDVAEALRVAELSAKETSILTSVERPVVLVSIRTDSPLTDEVAAGKPLVGLLLPYTPLHHLLLSESGRPLVILPAGVPDDLMLTSNAAVVARLRGAADIFLLNDRAIAATEEDSVVRVIGNRPRVERRSRGYVPSLLRLGWAVSRPTLGCGASPANAICFAWNDKVHLGAETPQVNEASTARQLEKDIDRVRDLFGVEPQVVAHDLDVRQASARFALDQASLMRVGVQHHHAHMASCMAENRLQGTAIAVVLDSGGAGTDGASWGGEILRGDYETFERLATFRPISLAGELVSSRQIWRVALALLDESFAGEPPLHVIPLFRNMPRRGIDVIRRVLGRGAMTPSHAAALQFDALAAIVLNLPDSTFDGSIASEWDAIASRSERGRYPIVIRDGVTPWEIDFRTVVNSAVTDLIAGVPAATIAAKARNSIVAVIAEILLAHGGGIDVPVVISGDYFEQTSLAEAIAVALGPSARVFTHAIVPSGDRGIALGQVMVANAKVSSGRVEDPRDLSTPPEAMDV